MKSNISRRDFLRKSALAGLGTTLGLSSVVSFPHCTVQKPFDTLIINGLVYTGDGTAPVHADVGIRNGRIEVIGRVTRDADCIVDAHGLAVSPGFIDIHSHTDTNLLDCPAGDSRIFQGVTSEAGGNCGDSPFPNGPYPNAKAFLDDLKNHKIGINYATYTGQGSLRAAVVGEANVAATPEQVKTMSALLDEQLAQGSIGLSCGLEYAPGAYATNAEIVSLLKVVAKRNKLFAIHMRNEDDRVEEALAEAIGMARESGVRLQISHLKAQNFANWHKGPALLKQIEEARAAGIDIAFDRYPYTAFATGLSSFIPLTDRQGTTADVVARLKDTRKAAEMGIYAQSRFARLGGPQNVVISACALPHNKETYMGKDLGTCAALTGKTPWEFVRDLLIEENVGPDIVAFAMTEDNVHLFLAHPLGMPASDGSVYSPEGPLSLSIPHPRSYGTFPRFLGKYCREDKIVDLPTAIHKITALPAQRLGLKDRGLLLPGYAADVVIFNPDTILDTATFEKPHQFATGIEHVWVNGAHAIASGKHTGALAGQII